MSAESFLYDDCRVWEGTNKEWFRDVLETLFDQVDSFSGKRPNCNSSWYRDITAHMEEHSTDLQEVLDALFEPEKRKEILLGYAEENVERYKAALLNVNSIHNIDVNEFDGMPMLTVYTDLPMNIQEDISANLEATIESIIGQDVDYQIIFREQSISH